MFKLGEKQTLTVVKKVEFGVYLAQPDAQQDEKIRNREQERVLLPIKQVPAGCECGDEITVFIYKDSRDRLIATTNEPKLMMGQVALLKVAQTGRIGAFLDWGLEKDLFLPFKEQTGHVVPGDEVLVSLYVDKSDRLCAKMNVYESLRTDSPYSKDDRVNGKVYELSDNFGAFVAVDNIYSALIPKRELYGDVRVGDNVCARVIKVHEDGKLELGIREKAYLQMDKDADELFKLIESYDGVLPFNDKASPEVIRRKTGMSKNEFKRAVGRLLKSGKIEIGDSSIRLK